MDDAVIAWQTGYFEGMAVFRAEDPGPEKPAQPDTVDPGRSKDGIESEKHDGSTDPGPPDPNKAGIRIDLSSIGAKP